jgi:hypothetical protein
MPDPVPLIQTALFERFGERLEIAMVFRPG